MSRLIILAAAVVMAINVSCINRLDIGKCFEQDGSIVRVTNTRGMTMVYLQAWNSDVHRWTDRYPADIWFLMGWHNTTCPGGN